MFSPVNKTVRKKNEISFVNYLCTTFNEIDILLNYMEDRALLFKDTISLNLDIQY